MWTDNVPITPESTYQYVATLLKEYDEAIETGRKPDFNPYKDKIKLNLDNGESLQVPERVRKETVIKWNMVKNHEKNKSVSEYILEYIFCILFIIMLIFLLTQLRKVVLYMKR
jgi:hypothetical protein